MSLIGWRREGWSASIEAETGARLEELRTELQDLQVSGNDFEVELEMLDALERLSQLRQDAAGRTLPPSRCLFVGGGTTRVIPWHTVHHVLRADRDLLLARAEGTDAGQFRFNTYTDAAIAAFLARRLKGLRSPRVL